MENFKLPLLPPPSEIETIEVLRQLSKSHRHLAELKGIVKTIPNEEILINTLSLQEAKSSSEIENIVTTHDDLYKQNIMIETQNPASKEVVNYAKGLKMGFYIVRNEKLLLNKDIIKIQEQLEQNKEKLAKATALKADFYFLIDQTLTDCSSTGNTPQPSSSIVTIVWQLPR